MRPNIDPLKIVPRTVPSRLIRSSRSVPSTHRSRIRTVDEKEFIFSDQSKIRFDQYKIQNIIILQILKHKSVENSTIMTLQK